MSSDSSVISLVILVLLLFLMAYNMFKDPKLIGQNVTKLFVWLGIFVLVIIGYAFRFEISGLKHRILAVVVPFYEWQDNQGRIVISRQQDGHFYINATANDAAEVKFLVDTGASGISLTREDAIKLGLDPKSLSYTQKSSTANGISYSAPVKLKKLQIGKKIFHNVSASVNMKGLDISLLGMSVIGDFKDFKITKDLLILEH